MGYLSSLVALFVIESILTLGLTFGYGTVGLLNFTYITFVAIGAYVGAIFSLGPPATHIGFHYIYLGTVIWPGNVILAGIVSAAAGAILSVGLLRGLRSDYLAIVTVAAGTIFYTVVGDTQSIFNGFNGFFDIPNPVQNIISPVGEQLAFAALCTVFLVLTILGLHLVRKSPMGRTLRAVREDGGLVETFGKNVLRYRFWSLIAMCFIAGIGGALLGEYSSAFNPTAYLPTETFILFAAVILGGSGNVGGAIFGAALVPVGIAEVTRFIPNIGSPTMIEELRGGLIGLSLIGVMIVRPKGIFPERPGSILEKGKAYLSKRIQSDSVPKGRDRAVVPVGSGAEGEK